MSPQRAKVQIRPAAADRPVVVSRAVPTLQLSCNGNFVRELPVNTPRVLIGRADENDLSIPSNYVSRHHIMLLRHNGFSILIDLNSTNGTFVNSKRVYNHILANDDVITVDLHSMFVQYSIKYCDPGMTSGGKPADTKDLDEIIAKAVSDVARQLGKSDTDLLPALSENEPTVLGFLDDR